MLLPILLLLLLILLLDAFQSGTRKHATAASIVFLIPDGPCSADRFNKETLLVQLCSLWLYTSKSCEPRRKSNKDTLAS